MQSQSAMQSTSICPHYPPLSLGFSSWLFPRRRHEKHSIAWSDTSPFWKQLVVTGWTCKAGPQKDMCLLDICGSSVNWLQGRVARQCHCREDTIHGTAGRQGEAARQGAKRLLSVPSHSILLAGATHTQRGILIPASQPLIQAPMVRQCFGGTSSYKPSVFPRSPCTLVVKRDKENGGRGAM